MSIRHSLVLVVCLGACAQAQEPVTIDSEIQALIDRAPEEQQAALADGQVSRAEYDAAARSYETCLHDNGWSEAEIEWQEPARQGLAGSWTTSVAGLTDATTPDFEATMEQCGDMHMWPLGNVYDRQHTDQRVLDQWLEELEEQGESVTVTDQGTP